MNGVTGVGQETIELGLMPTVATPVAQLSSEAAGNVAFGIGLAKFGFDMAALLYGVYACSQ